MVRNHDNPTLNSPLSLILFQVASSSPNAIGCMYINVKLIKIAIASTFVNFS